MLPAILVIKQDVSLPRVSLCSHEADLAVAFPGETFLMLVLPWSCYRRVHRTRPLVQNLVSWFIES